MRALLACMLMASATFAGDIGPPRPLGPCDPKQCSSSRVAGFEAEVQRLRQGHRKNQGLESLARELSGKSEKAQNQIIAQYFSIDASMDIEDIEAAIAKRTAQRQTDPLSAAEVGRLADIWVGAKE